MLTRSRESLKEEKGVMLEYFCEQESMRVPLWSAERQERNLMKGHSGVLGARLTAPASANQSI